MEVLEEHFFFENKGYQLFGVIHRPNIMKNNTKQLSTNKTKDIGLVICEPFAEEKMWTYRFFVNFARFLSQKGYFVMRFDYMGCGDSGGNHEQLTVSTSTSDILKAINLLREKTAVSKVGLLGLRLGAALASYVTKKTNIDFLVLLQPVIDGNAYFQECLRSNLATQFALYRKILNPRKQLVQELLDGRFVNVDGYLISPTFYQEVINLNMLRNPPKNGIPVLLIEIQRAKSNKRSSSYEEVVQLLRIENPGSIHLSIIEEPFWSELRTYFQSSQIIFESTISFIEEIMDGPPWTA